MASSEDLPTWKVGSSKSSCSDPRSTVLPCSIGSTDAKIIAILCPNPSRRRYFISGAAFTCAAIVSTTDYLFMKKTSIVLCSLCAFAFLAPGTAFAAKKNKNKAADPSPSVFSKYDKNGNGVLDDTEKEAIKGAFSKDPDLKQYDKNNDGKLDDSEIADIKPTPAAEPKKKRKKKKNA